MFEFISDWFSGIELEWDKLGIAFVIWAICLLVLWKMMADPTFMKFYIKVIVSIIMLPITYIILIVVGNK